MSLQPFLEAPLYIQIHAASAVVALVLGPVAIYRKRRDQMHKMVGYVWVVAMSITALTAFFIHSFAVIGPFSPLHGFALLTVWSLWIGVGHARRGNLGAHRAVFESLYWFGLLIAGLANFLPGRTSNAAAFGGADHLGWVVIGAGGALIVGRMVWRSRPRMTGEAAHVA